MNAKRRLLSLWKSFDDARRRDLFIELLRTAPPDVVRRIAEKATRSVSIYDETIPIALIHEIARERGQ